MTTGGYSSKEEAAQALDTITLEDLSVGKKVYYFSGSQNEWCPGRISTKEADRVLIALRGDSQLRPVSSEDVHTKVRMRYKEGQPLKYYSERKGDWFPCEVVEYLEDLSVKLHIGKSKTEKILAFDDQKYLREPFVKIDFKLGDKVEYHSFSNKSWIPAVVVGVCRQPPTGAIELDVKRGHWMSKRLQATRLRKPEDDGVEVKDAEVTIVEQPVNQMPGAGKVIALIVWNDYNWDPIRRDFGGPMRTGLDTEHGGRMMKDLLHGANVAGMKELSRQQCTRTNLVRAVYELGSQCEEDDTFIFYYTGHGSMVPDTDFDEPDGFDEALVLVDDSGKQPDYFIDDDLAIYLTSFVQAKQMFLIMDCCHSASAADLHKPCWHGKVGICLSGCQDHEEALATGQGGVFTHSILNATRALQASGTVSVARFYNQVYHDANALKKCISQHHNQSVCLSCSAGVDPNRIVWPLIP